MEEVVAHYGVAWKLVHGADGPELLKVCRCRNPQHRDLVVISRHCVLADGRKAGVSFVASPVEAGAWFGEEGWLPGGPSSRSCHPVSA